MDRRQFVLGSCGVGLAGAATPTGEPCFDSLHSYTASQFPVHAIVPVVGDGEWVWTEPPKDQTGYLEPRRFDLKVGVEMQGTDRASQIRATTVAPLSIEGQEIEALKIETHGCNARVRALTPQAGQLFMAASSIVARQVISAIAHYRLILYKDYRGYNANQFLAEQPDPRKEFRKQYLLDSPGIQASIRPVRNVVEEIASQLEHPWDKAKAFHSWVREHIVGRPQNYTSVTEALKKRIGDCEERAATFVAFCRAAGIPARLVWVPNHNWAEFYLVDEQGKGHWIPAHTAGYSWFGWTGAHELLLQKGDRIEVPEKGKRERLLADWVQWKGARPKIRFIAELTPVPTDAVADGGPGARRKDESGEWKRIGKHPLDPYGRDGKYCARRPPVSLKSQQDK